MPEASCGTVDNIFIDSEGEKKKSCQKEKLRTDEKYQILKFHMNIFCYLLYMDTQ